MRFVPPHPGRQSTLSRYLRKPQQFLAVQLLKNNEPQNRRGFITATSTITTNSIDTLIIGGGPVGLSTAYHLATQHRSNDGTSITIIERDPTYARSSATLSAGGIRQQFSLKENVEMSLYGRDFLRRASELLRVEEEELDVQFQEHGYLFLASSQSGKDQLIQNNEIQQDAGCADIHLLDPMQLQQTFPWLNTADILMGSYGAKGEGWFDPWALIRGLKRKCQSMGVHFIKGCPVGAVREEPSGRVISVDVLDQTNNKCSSDNSVVTTFNVNHVVNAAGAHCNSVMETLVGNTNKDGKLLLQYPIPVEPRKRCIFFIHCNTHQEDDFIVPSIAPLTVCPATGVYFRSEGLVHDEGIPTGNFLCGVSPTQEVDKAIDHEDELDYADHELWDEVIWPALYNRVPAFGDVKVKSSWAGLYEYNTFDQNAIIDQHPEMENVIMANGFSGHGLQQSPASGRAVAELISCNGRFTTLDLSIFRFDRCLEGGRPVLEAGIV